MTDHRSSRDNPEDDIAAADLLLSQADALLRRHRSTPIATNALDDFADIPILTDVVDDFDPHFSLEHTTEQHTESPVNTAPPPTPEISAVDIDTLSAEIRSTVDTWLAHELPAVISRELEGLNERLRQALISDAKARLLPSLSEQIAAILENQSTKR